MDHGWLRRLQKRRAWNSAPPRCATARPPDPGAAPRRARRTSSSAGAGPCRGLARRDGQARLRDTPDLFYLMNLMILHASWDKNKSFRWGTAVCGLQIARIAETEQTRAYPGRDGGIAGVFIMYLHFLDSNSYYFTYCQANLENVVYPSATRWDGETNLIWNLQQ